MYAEAHLRICARSWYCCCCCCSYSLLLLLMLMLVLLVQASRRLKTELLIQMDGLNKTDDLVFLLAASNLPWCVPLCACARCSM